MKKLLQKIGQIFTSVFNGAKKAFNALDPEEQEALKTGSGLAAVIQDNLEKAPEAVIEALQKQFPKLNAKKLEESVFSMANSVGLTKFNSLVEAVDAIQEFVRTKTGRDWANAMDTIAKGAAIFLAPKKTKASVIFSLMVFVYHTFIKKD